MAKAHVLLMHNPQAGAADHSAPALCALLRARGFRVRYQSTKVPGYAAALEKRCDFVVAAGGDGTVRKVAKHLVGRDTPLAILPLGTANNIAKSLGAYGEARALVAAWNSAPVQKLDVGVAKGPWGRKYFLESFGSGLLADAMVRPEAQPKDGPDDSDARGEHLREMASLLQRFLASYGARELQVTLDDEDISGSFLLLEALNMKRAGPSLVVAPAADPGDGVLDFVLCTERDRGTIDDYLRRRADGYSEPLEVPVRRGRRLRFVWRGAPLHVDGKPWPAPGDRPARDGAPLELVSVKLKKRALALMVGTQSASGIAPAACGGTPEETAAAAA